MPYVAGTIAPQTNCALAFMNAMDPLLVAGGLTFVEEFYNVSWTARVYKSPAASNYFGSDWFLWMRRATDASTSVQMGVTEQYNSSTHLCFNYPPSSTSATPTAQFAINDAAGKSIVETGNVMFQMQFFPSQTVTLFYYTSFTPNRCVIATRIGSTELAWYFGLYDDFLPLSISPFPLCVVQLTPNSMSGGVGTREPNKTVSGSNNFRMGTGGSVQTSDTEWPRTFGVAGAPETYSGKVFMSRVVLRSARTGASLRGLCRDVWHTGYNGMHGANGDQLSATIDGVPKTLAQTADTGSLAFFVDTAL